MSTLSITRERVDTTGAPSPIELDLLPVGVTTRARTIGYQAPDKVCSAADLPSRLYLGDLVQGSFRTCGNGWTARYRDAAPDTGVDLEYRASTDSGSLIATLAWAGISDLKIAARDWTTLARYMAFDFPRSWERAAKRTLETAFNLRLTERTEFAPLMSGFPDGPIQSLVFPVPSSRLRALTTVLAAIDADAEIAAPVSVFVTTADTQVDYIDGRCADVPNTPRALAAHSRRSTGLACDGKPASRTIDGGVRALTLRRWVFVAHVVCSFRDLTRVVSTCGRHGFIGARDDAAPGTVYPGGVEWSAVVLPVGCGARDATIRFFDHQQTRRLTYTHLLPPDRLKALARLHDISHEEASKRLAAAETWAQSEPDIV